jgi:hypothetical protein
MSEEETARTISSSEGCSTRKTTHNVSSKQTMHAFLGLEVNNGSNENNDKRALFWLPLSGECSTK